MDLSVATELKNSTSIIPIDEHFKLYAGPGAGKTTFLTNHIKRILHQSSKLGKAKKVACITYTNTAVNTLINKLEDSIESLEICTIHSFCYKHIVKPYIWVLKDNPLPIDKIDGHEQIKLRRSQIIQLKTDIGQRYLDDVELADVLNKLQWFLEDGIPILKFLNAHDGRLGKYFLKEEAYYKYKNLYWAEGKLSHDDVLYFAYRILMEDDRIKDIIRAKFPYILIDEFQDTSPLQTEIIKMIGQKETNIGLIGDLCQSIYSFQGANVESFEIFSLENMNLYTLKGNHRSSSEIINVLNHMRKGKDFEQFSPDHKSGESPSLLIGTKKSAYQYLHKKSKRPVVLTYKKETSSSIEYDTESLEDLNFNVILQDSNGDRGWRIFHIIQSIELAKQFQLKEALKIMKRAYRKEISFTDKDAFINLKRLLNMYNEFENKSITYFHNDFILGQYNVTGLISRGAVKALYDGLTYKKVVIQMKILEEMSNFKTIHHSKGDEFENVLVIVPEKKRGAALSFLLSPNMNIEEHRVYYVALSRAISGLYINIEKLEENEKEALTKIGFEIIQVDESAEVNISTKELVTPL
ncbi:ATP-dependent helicase [Bacillus toyonensis]|uniref:ATP-dependent helicase n=1 Tax=Bacillus toyonensis TaxID=155322 RepID=UPI001EDD18C1|nr:ATP-dependent helicase [Bacillus toyonensis]UKS60774.1 ATP-dependent helicase [Bacillus toyonensis]